MRACQAAEHAFDDCQRRLFVNEGEGVEDVLEVGAVDSLHNDVVSAMTVLPHVNICDDVRMLQAGYDFSLAKEPLPALRCCACL